MYYLSANFFSFTWEVDLLQCRSLPSLSYNVPLLSRKKKKKKKNSPGFERNDWGCRCASMAAMMAVAKTTDCQRNEWGTQ